MELTVKRFQELTAAELYEILKARAEIFIVEQKINYQDMDDRDYESLHCFFMEEGQVAAYLRAFPMEERRVKIGRVLTRRHGNGMGRLLLEKSLEAVTAEFPCEKIRVDAQKHAVGFYEKFGFRPISGEFWEEGILHISMEREAV